MKKLLSCLLTLLSLALITFAEVDLEGASVGKWTMDLDAAKELAAEKKLPILLSFSGSDWCHWCQMMESAVFEQEEWSAYATNSLIMVLLDYPQDTSKVPEHFVLRNQQLNEQFGVEGFPTFILLESDGKTELGRLSASEGKTPAGFQMEIKALLRNSEEAMLAYAATLPEEDRKKYEALTTGLSATKEAIAQQEKNLQQAQQQLEILNEKILLQQDELREFRVTQLPDEQQKTFHDLKLLFDSKRDALVEWINTDPAATAENQTKFQTMQEELQEIAIKLQAY